MPKKRESSGKNESKQKFSKCRQVEESLLAKERELASIYANVPEVLFFLSVKDESFRFLSVSQSFLKSTGLTENQVVEKSIQEVIPKPSLSLVLEKYAQAIRERKTVTWEEVTDYPSGRKHGEVAVAPLFDSNGRCTNLIGSVHDLTERKKAEEQLGKSEERYRHLLNALPEIVFETDENGKVTYANQSAFRITGYTKEDIVLGFCLFDLIVQKDRKRAEENFKSILKSNPSFGNEYTLLKKDGSTLPIIIVSTPIVLKNRTVGLRGIALDITKRKKVEEELLQSKKNLEQLVAERTEGIRKSEQRYRELYESFDEAFMATDWDLNVIHWNKAAERITRVDTADALGKKIYAVLPEMTSVDIGPYLEALQQKKPARFMMNTVSRETNREAIFEISTYPSTTGIVIIVEDKTELEQIKRLSAIGQVAGMVGHDIRNPLQAITGDVYLAKLDLASLPESEDKNSMCETISSIEKNVDYISKIVADLQDYARPLKPAAEETDIKRIIEELLEKNVLSKNYVVNINVEPDARKVVTDSGFINRIMYNLVTNAVQAMPNGGKITINAWKEENDFVITVKDAGIGISKEVREKLFTPMFTTKAKGQGFGLVVIKRMTEALGGTVTFESQEGKGTTFMIRLPQKLS